MSEPNAEPVPTPAPPPAPGAPAEHVPPLVPPAILPLMRLLPPPPVGTILAPPELHDPAKHSWFLVQLWAELRLAVRMYFDPRYRISRLAQVAFPLALVLMVASYFFFAQLLDIRIFSPLMDRLCDVVLAVLLYRVLQRELERYKAVLDYLSRFTAPR